MNPNNPSIPSASADEAGSGGSSGASGTLAETKTKIAETASKLKASAAEVADRAKDEAGRVAEQRKQSAAERIDDYSSALHGSAQSFEEKDPNIAWFAHRAADRLQGAADYVRTRDFPAMRRDAEDLARRHPAAFYGGLFLAGLVLGNVVKASQRKLEASEDFSSETDDESDSPQSHHEMELPELTDADRSAAGI